MKKESIVFIYPHSSSFIDEDISILESKFKVIHNTYNWANKKYIPLYFLHQLLLVFRIPFAKSVVVSFGGYWAIIPHFISRIFKRNFFVILHGTDVVDFPELNYGSLRDKRLKKLLRRVYSYPTRLLPVSESLITSENQYSYSEKSIRQGVTSHYPDLHFEYSVVHNGIDVEKWEFINNPNRKGVVSVISEGQFWLKGGDLIIRLAERFPEESFLIVGCVIPPEVIAPKNVRFTGKLTSDELFDVFKTQFVYLQLSHFEGFGCALCEAMSVGVIPIVSRVNQMPLIVENSDLILDFNEVSELAKKMGELFSLNTQERLDLSKSFSSQIASNYSKHNRSERLLKELDVTN